MKFALGQIVKEKITGFTGVIMARTEHITGCTQYGILPRTTDKDGQIPSWTWLDEDRLEATGKIVEIQKQNNGGPAPSCPSR